MIRIALLGFGRWGRNYARVLADLPGARLAAVADPDAEAAIARPDIDAVVIATPASTHHALARRALLARKHVLVEKPLALAAKGADEIAALARAGGLIALVGHTFLYHPGIAAMKALLEEPPTGALRYIAARRVNLGPVRADVSALWDLAAHDVAIASHLAGAEPLRVSAVDGRWLDPQRSDAAFLTLSYPRGVRAQIHVSWIDATKVREVVAVAAARRIVFDDLAPEAKLRVYENAADPRAWPGGGLPAAGGWTPPVPREEPLRALCAHFVRAIEGREPPRTPAEQGARVVRVLEAAERSIARGGSPVVVAKGTGAPEPAPLRVPEDCA